MPYQRSKGISDICNTLESEDLWRCVDVGGKVAELGLGNGQTELITLQLLGLRSLGRGMLSVEVYAGVWES
jgi:hypothetical protein